MKHEAPKFDHESLEHLLPTAEQAEPLRSGEIDPQKTEADKSERTEEARNTIEEQAESDNPLEQHNEAEKAAQSAGPTHVNSELKSMTLQRELRRVQRQLPSPQRVLSRVMHQKVVRVASEAAGKSVSRPSGLLGGGITAFLGTTSYLYFAHHIGLAYNYSVFLVLFFGGFALGLILELLVHAFTRQRRSE